MTDRARQSDHDRVEALLPWYVNETLADAERSAVERHLGDCAACRAALSELRELQQAVRRHPATPIVPVPDVGRLLDRLESSDAAPRRVGPRWAVAASIGAVLLALLGWLITAELPGPERTRFQTATSAPESSLMDYVLDLRFDEGLGAAQRERILENLDAAIVSAPDSFGAYRVVVKIPASTVEELDRYTRAIAAIDGVESVDVVALQLPVRREP